MGISAGIIGIEHRSRRNNRRVRVQVGGEVDRTRRLRTDVAGGHLDGHDIGARRIVAGKALALGIDNVIVLVGMELPVAGVQNIAAGVLYAEHAVRSEEHTSELQSLMRTSYAVFCL